MRLQNRLTVTAHLARRHRTRRAIALPPLHDGRHCNIEPARYSMATLAGLGVGGAVGGVVGALIGMGIPEYEAKRYEGRVKEGGILVSVHCDSSDEVSRAKDILKGAGGDDVASSGEKSVSSHTIGSDDTRTYARREPRSESLDTTTEDEVIEDDIRTRRA